MLWENIITQLVGMGEFEVVGGNLSPQGEVIIGVRVKWEIGICPKCGEYSSSVLEYKNRAVRDLSMSGRKVYISFQHRRFRCQPCQSSFFERLSNIEPPSHYTKRYEEWIVSQVNQSNIKSIAQQEELSWEAVNNILHRVAKRSGLLANPTPKRWLALDEISLKKRHKQFVLVISAPEQGTILAVLPERTKEKLSEWFEQTWTGQQREQIAVVTIDMWEGYYGAVYEHLPNAVVVIDRFHVQKNLLDAITKLRRQIQKSLPDADKAILKGIRWLLVSNYDDLDDDEKLILDTALDACPQLALCHFVKEEFRDWYEEDQDVFTAEKKLRQWQNLALSLGSTALHNFVNTLHNWKDSILNYFDERLSNGFAEGLNNSLQLLKRRAFGFRNFFNFRLRALLLHSIP